MKWGVPIQIIWEDVLTGKRASLQDRLGNLTPADVYSGRGQTIMLKRERIKRETIRQRRLLHRKAAA